MSWSVTVFQALDFLLASSGCFSRVSGRPDGGESETFHYCGCGSQTETHSPEYFDPDIGVCGPCGKSRDKGRGGLPGNDSKTTTDPSSSDPMPPPNGPNDPNNPNDPFSPRNPRSPNPDNPDNPDNPTPPDPPFPQLPDLPSNPNGGNSSTTIDPNVHINNWVRVEFQL